MHKAGFVSVVGYPNVGKSTLLNKLINYDLFIVTPKAQTTRKRIFGFYNDEDTQIVFSDTPGFILKPVYKLHNVMNEYVDSSFEDSDLIMLVTEPNIKNFNSLAQKIKNSKIPLIIIVNKADLFNTEQLNLYSDWLKKEFNCENILIVSALYGSNTDKIIPLIKEFLPEHPPYYPKEDLSDKNLRFFVSEIIRKHIYNLYQKEIPYCSEVVIDEYSEKENITVIRAIIFVERESQKMIILGKDGKAIKQLGIEARKEIENFIEQKVHLELTVKVLKNWRNDEKILKKLGFTKFT